MIAQQKGMAKEHTDPRRSRNHGFRVGDEVRTVGGGPYDRGRIVEATQGEKYYGVDYGLGYHSAIREESLEPFDGTDPAPELPRSSVPPILPFL
jgi:hypothetical protein